MGSVNAETERPLSPTEQIFQKLESSVFKLNVFQRHPFFGSLSRQIGFGTAYVVSADDSETVMVSALHVIKANDDNITGLFYEITYKGKEYRATNVKRSNLSDACFLFFPPMEGVKELEIDSSPSDGIVDIISASAVNTYELDDNPSRKVVWSHGQASRKVCEKYLMYFGTRYKLVQGYFYGTSALMPGYSGGPAIQITWKNGLIDKFSVIGTANFLSSTACGYADIRVLLNEFPGVLGNPPIEIPYSDTFDVFNSPKLKRIAFNRKATYESPLFKTTLGEIADAVSDEVGIDPSKDIGELLGKVIGADALIEMPNGDFYRVTNFNVGIVDRFYINADSGRSEDSPFYIMFSEEHWRVGAKLDKVSAEEAKGIRKGFARIKADIEKAKEKAEEKIKEPIK